MGGLWKQCLRIVLVLFGISTIAFFLIHLSGDPVLLMLPPEATQEEIDAFRHQMGFDRPLSEQYVNFLVQAVQGDFGKSLKFHQPSLDVVLERIPATLELTLFATLLSIVIAIPLGIYSAVNRNSLSENLVTVAVFLGQSMPIFWTGIMLMLLFGVKLHWLPVSGRGTFAHLIMPAFTLAVWVAPTTLRIVRSSMLEVLQQDYIRTARSKGLAEKVVIYKHALKNAAIPIITVIGFQIGKLLGGAVVTETVFAWPGVGQLVVKAIYTADYPLVQACVVILALIVATMNFSVDSMYRYLNPKIKSG
ncbi:MULTISPECIES: ABC transporter permease [Brevibacillus]|jgi:peptide/nickel transport system permease protein|uniref:Binding-protein-dependent transport system inner membrane protein n=1 Tax=Brevibacillus borstelensis AK1 TaxID=1300222 RepID=M8D735_9BACL|nr:ABC transporter permease [Brevibacillus borstelensis]EMT52059.1 binding-protein-dependent transport system inner membrane protein [Brevibacillus borstelensis AK1]KKX53562.1 ABC transporter permease [Brevibacillus borstelensis cifa_chp40]MBE5396055.1 ABC transporter permease [Brevibacillus borstelensis]MCC0566621.1 ABC transporter permease [Brevibacillus borstelensis]MCM3472654.1 ABC transporter permease [Brevibacillus borstelensis]